MKFRPTSFILAGLVAGLLSTAALAQAPDYDPNHPRVNEVNQRLDNQNNRIQQGVQDGQIKPGQAARDEKRDARIARQEQRDKAKHDGHLTKREQKHMNKELNHDSHDIHKQRHDGQ